MVLDRGASVGRAAGDLPGLVRLTWEQFRKFIVAMKVSKPIVGGQISRVRVAVRGRLTQGVDHFAI